jgi:hypothetical protein
LTQEKLQIGRRIYYDKVTGNIITDTGERSGNVRETQISDDFASYNALSERSPQTVGIIQLEFGELSEDFVKCDGYRVNPDTKTLEFTYPDLSVPPTPPVFQKPLTEQMKDVKEKLARTEQALSDSSMTTQQLLELLIDMGVI